jgi:hypothetical protein
VVQNSSSAAGGSSPLQRQLQRELAHGRGVVVSAEKFMVRLEKYMPCSCSVFIAALQFLDRVSARSGVCLNRRNFHRLFFGCFTLAHKVVEDETLSQRRCAQVGGFVPHDHGTRAGMAELYHLETLLCQVLGWELTVDEGLFWRYFGEIERITGLTARVLGV